MGLDQFAIAIQHAPEKPVDFPESEGAELFHQWRKHPNLQGWMQRLYAEKGGQDKDFNCSPVVVTLEDLAVLESDIRTAALPETTGFFFGKSSPEDAADDLKFIAKAREKIAAGMTVVYNSWW